MDIKAAANCLVRKYHTRNPFYIAEGMNFVIIFAPLVEMRGFQQCVKKRRFIYINSDLDEQQQILVSAHELGHHILHRNMNRIFMDHNTGIVTQKYENEANQFSVGLIYDDDELQPFLIYGIPSAANYMGVSYELAEYRMREVVPEFINYD